MNMIKKKLYEVLELALEPPKQPDIKAIQNLDLSLGIRKEGVNVIQIQSVINNQIALGIVQIIKMVDGMQTGTLDMDIVQTLAIDQTPWQEAQHQFNAEYLRKVLDTCGGNQSEGARVLKMTRPYINRLIKKYL